MFRSCGSDTRRHELVPTALIQRLLDRHFNNDWGDLDEHDAQMNAEAVSACDGQRVHSSYSWPKKVGLKENIWIITYLHSIRSCRRIEPLLHDRAVPL